MKEYEYSPKQVKQRPRVVLHMMEMIRVGVDVPSESESVHDHIQSINRSESDTSEDWPEYTSLPCEIDLGMTFRSLGEIKDLVVDYAIRNGYNVRFIKNEKNVRLTAICADGCKWRMHASKKHNEDTYQIKIYNNVHSCARVMENRHAKAEWVMHNYQDRFRSHDTWQIPSIIETVRQDYHVNISPTLAYRARCLARKLNDGCAVEQYKLLWSYAAEVRRSNLGSSFFVGLERVTETSPATFQRAYMCFNACKEGLLAGGRPLICLDGCHLKGHCPGHLLSAVGIDGNNGIYPIALAVVESECTASWKWFLDALLSDLHIVDGGIGWTFMSDQQKGLVDTLQTLVGGAEIRFCVRHLYANFKLKFPGKVYKDAMMSASDATTQYAFEKEMKKLSSINPTAYTHLRKINPACWAKYAFRHTSKCEMTTNNLAESFNSLILSARDKPILTMLEIIRKLIMTRIAKRHRTMQECAGLLCPRIHKKLNRLVSDSRNWSLIPAGGDRFEVSNPNVTYIVDVGNQSCTCCSWELTGIPCVHVIPCIFFLRRNVEEYVHRYYHHDTYLTMYGHFIHPLNDREMWPIITNMEEIMPPIVRRRPGRPKKKRIRDVDEPPCTTAVSRRNKKYVAKCRICHELGHNARTCKGRAASTSMGVNSQSDVGTQGSSYGGGHCSG